MLLDNMPGRKFGQGPSTFAEHGLAQLIIIVLSISNGGIDGIILLAFIGTLLNGRGAQ